jgi:hypothetical protein
MPVSGVVITLVDDEEARRQALATLSGDPRLTLGEAMGTRLPAVIETETIGEGVRMVRDELPGVEGIAFVDVVSVDFSDL